jgi:hypothetical protein
MKSYRSAYCDRQFELSDNAAPRLQVQDPAQTYGDPAGALAEPKRRIEQAQNAIDGFDQLYPRSQSGKTIGNLGGFR